MKKNIFYLLSFTLAGLLALTPLSLAAGLEIKETAKPIPTLEDLKLTLPNDLGSLTFYGADRFRFHLWDYAESAPFDNSYDFFANQLRLGTRLDNPFITAHAAWQYTHLWTLPSGSSAGAGAGALYFSNGTQESESIGTYLKYMEAGLKDKWDTGITLSAGRFDYSSGNTHKVGAGKGYDKEEKSKPLTKKVDWLQTKRVADRLIGGFGWSEFQRSFDGIKEAYENAKIYIQHADFIPTQGGFEEGAGSSIEDIRLSTTELVLKKDQWLPNTEISLFHYYWIDTRLIDTTAARPDNTGRSVQNGFENDVDVDTFGGHLIGAQKIGDGQLDYLFWGAWQTGSWFELDHEAYSLAGEGGYQFTELPWKPWIRGGYNVGSGDPDASDGDHETFYQLIPTARIYSQSILYNLMNTEDTFVSLIVKPCSVLTIRSDVHWIALEDSSDRWYLGGGPLNRSKLTDYTGRASNGSDELGTMADITVTWEVNPNVTVSAYYGHLDGGEVVKSFYSRETDVNYFFVEAAVTF